MTLSLLFVGPVLTASGYGVHARQILSALNDTGEFDIHVESIKWGDTSFVSDDSVKWIQPLIYARHAAGNKNNYDISVQVTIPNEFKKVARLNIGITAGIEVDRVSPTWLVKVNEETDVLVLPSRHSYKTFTDTKYSDAANRVLAITTPAIVVPESVPALFSPRPGSRSKLLENIPDKNLLVVGLGLDKQIGEDRKNISNTVLWFLKEFKDDKNVGLVLKTGIVNNSLFDMVAVRNRVLELKAVAGVTEYPKITIVHGRLSDEDLLGLYTDERISALVSLTHGEGFGLPMLEAAACGLPVVATDWSGHVDFLTSETGENMHLPVSYTLGAIPKSCVWPGVMEEGSRWANASEQSARKLMREAVSIEDRSKYIAHSEYVRSNFSQLALQSRLMSVIEQAWRHTVITKPVTRDETIASIKSQFGLASKGQTLLFTMPMSGGDVYLSTGVLASILSKFEKKPYVYFATKEQYKTILEDNPDIDEVIEWQTWMQDVGLLEDIFDHVYTPNLAIQMVWSNWVHGGQGRSLFHEIASQCNVRVEDLQAPKIGHVNVSGLPEKYIVIHTGSGKGQWGARRYNNWQGVVDNVREYDSSVQFVQVGLGDEPLLNGCVDFRGKTPDYKQLAFIVANSLGVVSIDSMVMHIAAHHGKPHVALFGGSYAKTTGTSFGGLETCAPKVTLIEVSDRLSCKRACYKNECIVDADNPCINTVQPAVVFASVLRTILGTIALSQLDEYKLKFKHKPIMISGYTHTFNAKKHGYPFVQSIKSMLGFCSEVVVVDGGSTDGTLEDIAAIGDDRVKVINNTWDPDEPGMDGMQKAFARIMCDPSSEFLWQQDCDEVVHETDYEKIHDVARKFPRNVDVIHLPVVELWGDKKTVRTDRHAWKWRMSRNSFNVTHGIVKSARVLDKKTGRTYAKPGMSDGCEYIDVMTGEYLPHAGFWNSELEKARVTNPEQYGKMMNEIFGKLPSVFHYSWANIPRKVKNFIEFWDNQWSTLYMTKNEPRFPGVVTEDDIKRVSEELKARGGEHGAAKTFTLQKSEPEIMNSWEV